MTPAPWRQVVAIVQDVLRAYPNVTDAKDVAWRVLARRRLAVDVATLNRALDAALAVTPRRPDIPGGRLDTPRGPRVDWSQLRRRLIAAGLPVPEGAPLCLTVPTSTTAPARPAIPVPSVGAGSTPAA